MITLKTSLKLPKAKEQSSAILKRLERKTSSLLLKTI